MKCVRMIISRAVCKLPCCVTRTVDGETLNVLKSFMFHAIDRFADVQAARSRACLFLFRVVETTRLFREIDSNARQRKETYDGLDSTEPVTKFRIDLCIDLNYLRTCSEARPHAERRRTRRPFRTRSVSLGIPSFLHFSLSFFSLFLRVTSNSSLARGSFRLISMNALTCTPPIYTYRREIDYYLPRSSAKVSLAIESFTKIQPSENRSELTPKVSSRRLTLTQGTHKSDSVAKQTRIYILPLFPLISPLKLRLRLDMRTRESHLSLDNINTLSRVHTSRARNAMFARERREEKGDILDQYNSVIVPTLLADVPVLPDEIAHYVARTMSRYRARTTAVEIADLSRYCSI